MRYYLKFNYGSYLLRSDASGTIGTIPDDWVKPPYTSKGKIIGELVGIVWDEKFPQESPYPTDAHYLFFTKNLEVSQSDDKGNPTNIETVSGYFYIYWKGCEIVDENGKVIPFSGKDPEQFWRGLFSGWGNAKQSIKSNVAPKEDSFFGQLWFYFLKYWWLLLIFIFWNTFKGIFTDLKKVTNKFKKRR